MANDEHLKLLKQGVEAWNTWRSDYTAIWPDLAGADLSKANLPRVDLFRATLANANLSEAALQFSKFNGSRLHEANLREANFLGATLYATRLNGADLRGAILCAADLTTAKLTAADLTGANLNRANLNGADLSGVDLTRAKLSETVFANTNLQNATGLEFCYHSGRSSLDLRTLQKSWPLPLPFLRGCGLPDTYIKQLPSLLAPSAIQFYSCFISYSSDNLDFVQRLYGDLQNTGVRCWYAPEDLKIGDEFAQAIQESIRQRDKLLLVLSEQSIESKWVEDEVNMALEEESRKEKQVLFPIRIDDAIMDTTKAWAGRIKRKRHMGDFTNWKDRDAYKKALNQLIQDLKEEKEPITKESKLRDGNN